MEFGQKKFVKLIYLISFEIRLNCRNGIRDEFIGRNGILDEFIGINGIHDEFMYTK